MYKVERLVSQEHLLGQYQNGASTLHYKTRLLPTPFLRGKVEDQNYRICRKQNMTNLVLVVTDNWKEFRAEEG